MWALWGNSLWITRAAVHGHEILSAMSLSVHRCHSRASAHQPPSLPLGKREWGDKGKVCILMRCGFGQASLRKHMLVLSYQPRANGTCHSGAAVAAYLLWHEERPSPPLHSHPAFSSTLETHSPARWRESVSFSLFCHLPVLCISTFIPFHLLLASVFPFCGWWKVVSALISTDLSHSEGRDISRTTRELDIFSIIKFCQPIKHIRVVQQCGWRALILDQWIISKHMLKLPCLVTL